MEPLYTSKLRAVGGSVMFAIPKPMLDRLGLHANQEVGVAINDGRIVIEPKIRPRYKLEELLAQCDPDVPLSDDEKEWMDIQAVGNEKI